MIISYLTHFVNNRMKTFTTTARIGCQLPINFEKCNCLS